jgi:hypothetical protein
MKTMTQQRKASIEAQAEEVAITLIKNGLVTNDPRYTDLCRSLAPFKPLLAKHGKADEAAARRVIRNGFRTIKLKPIHGESNDDQVLRLLNALIDKLTTMARLMGLLKR